MTDEHVSVPFMSAPALCEKLIPSGRACAVTAIGRCHSCGDAFCQTHQARTGGHVSTVFVDWCKGCQVAAATARAAEESAGKAQEAARAAAEREKAEVISSRVAVLKKILVESDRSVWQERRRHVRYRSFMGVSLPDVTEPLERAIPVGQLGWRFPLIGDYNTLDPYGPTVSMKSGLTAAGKIVLMERGRASLTDSDFRGVMASSPAEIAERLEATARAFGIHVPH